MLLIIIGLPIPGELILTFAGYLVSKNDLQLIPSIISSSLGSISGISISFLLGRTFGIRILNKLNHIFHISDKSLYKTKKWLESNGSWLFVFGYYIPGVRHLTAIFAGSTQIKYSKFVSIASVGGFLWSLTFILLGYYTGKKLTNIITQIHTHIFVVTFIILLLLILYFIFRVKIQGKNKH